MSLRFDVDGTDATWITADLASRSASRPGDDDEVARTLLLGPRGFEAYARVLALPDPQYPGQSEAEIDEKTLDAFPSDIDLVSDTIGALSDCTATPDDLCFLFWDGWPYSPELPPGSRVNLANWRLCAPARGTRTEWLGWVEHDREGGYAPNFVWPVDRAWCVVYDVDAHFAGVGGSIAAIDLLFETPTLKVTPASRDALPPMYE